MAMGSGYPFLCGFVLYSQLKSSQGFLKSCRSTKPVSVSSNINSPRDLSLIINYKSSYPETLFNVATLYYSNDNLKLSILWLPLATGVYREDHVEDYLC